MCFPEWPDRLDNLVFLDLLYGLEKLAIQDIMAIKITVPRYNAMYVKRKLDEWLIPLRRQHADKYPVSDSLETEAPDG